MRIGESAEGEMQIESGYLPPKNLFTADQNPLLCFPVA